MTIMDEFHDSNTAAVAQITNMVPITTHENDQEESAQISSTTYVPSQGNKHSHNALKQLLFPTIMHSANPHQMNKMNLSLSVLSESQMH